MPYRDFMTELSGFGACFYSKSKVFLTA